MNNEETGVKKQIRQAFFSLLSKKSYLEITVTDLVKEAGVARVSYYRNFSSLDDVLEDAVKNFIVTFKEQISPLFADGEDGMRDFLSMMFGKIARTEKRVNTILSVNVSMLSSRILEVTASLFPQTDLTEGSYRRIAKLGAINAIARQWFLAGMREPPEEMTELALRIVNKL